MRCAVLVLAALALPALAQTRNERHSPLGVSLSVPRKYSPMPVPSTEKLVQLRYLGEESKRGLRPDLYLVRIEWGEDPTPVPDPPPVHSFEGYLEQHMKPWKIGQTKEAQSIDGWVTLEHRLEREIKPPRPGEEVEDESPWAAWAIERQDGFVSWIVLGFCDREEVDGEVKQWRQCAQKLKFFAPTAAEEEAKWSRYYRFHTEFRNGELRTIQRSRLLDGWDWEDTSNFVFLSSSDKSVLMRDLQKKLEGIRKHYTKLFPPVAEITAVSTVRVCKDAEEYYEYGGSQYSAGYWNARAQELVFYENGKEDSRIVLYHEAFHQYVYYAVGEVAPHPWFNEGYGDYFSGAEFNTHGDVVRIHVNPWRVEAIRRFIGECPSWDELIHMEQADFMKLAPVHYPMAWSIVYFLEEAKVVEQHPRWGQILPIYYETLRSTFAHERERLAAAGKEADEKELDAASKTAREAAVTAAFKDVDLDGIKRAWSEFVFSLKLPK